MRSTVQLISQQVEDTLRTRNAAPFSRRVRSEQYTGFGISALDSLTRGVPAGALTEMVGPESSGRTTAALSVVSALVQGGGVCAWVDVADVFDPESAAANGVDLARLLWVRCGEPSKPAFQHRARTAQSVSALMHKPHAMQVPHLSGGSPHPRSEGRDMPEAIGAILRAHGGLYDRQVRHGKRLVGTPGAPNRPVSYCSEIREEQVDSDRRPARRGDNLALVPRSDKPQPLQTTRSASSKRNPEKQSDLLDGSVPISEARLWKPLDQALRSTDLLLHNGGFGAIVLDLGGVPPEFAWRIPLPTWFRFRAACERTRTSLILLTQHTCARSSAELVLRLEAGRLEALGNVMAGVHYNAAMERSRFAESEPRVVSIRKPPQPERPGQWKIGAAWV